VLIDSEGRLAGVLGPAREPGAVTGLAGPVDVAAAIEQGADRLAAVAGVLARLMVDGDPGWAWSWRRCVRSWAGWAWLSPTGIWAS
jgi:hypothetical protein